MSVAAVHSLAIDDVVSDGSVAPGPGETTRLKPIPESTPIMTPVPPLSLLVLSIVMLSEFLSANVSAPFILFMVKSFDVEDAAFWTGLLVSSFFFTQFTASMFWTTLAAQTSPRFVMIMTLLGSSFSTLAFGCSQNLQVAMVARLAQGIFGGGIGVARGSVTSIADASNEGKVWGVLGFCWAMGGIAGAVIGGTFEHPALKWTSQAIFNNRIFVAFPYLLPCAIASFVTLTGGVLACFLAPNLGPKHSITFDTEKYILPGPQSVHADSLPPSRFGSLRIRALPIPRRVSQLFSENSGDGYTPLLSSSFTEYSSVCSTENLLIGSIPRSRPCSKTRVRGPKSVNSVRTEHVENLVEEDQPRGRASDRSLLFSLSRPTSVCTLRPAVQLSTDCFFPRTDTIDTTLSVLSEPAIPIPLPPIIETNSTEKQLVDEKAGMPVALIIQYGLLALHTTTHDQVFLSYFVSPYEEGGLGLGSGAFAQLIALMCFFQLFYQFYVYSKISPPNGPFTTVTLLRISSVLFMVAYLTVVFYRGMFTGNSLMYALVASTAVRYCGLTFAFTSIAILINSMTPPQSVGFANGLAQSIASLARCFGPIFGGSLWSISTEANPSDFYLSFVACAAVCLVAFVLSFRIKSTHQ